MSRKQYTVVIGLGKTGFSCVRFLLTKGHEVVVVDSRSNPPCLEELQRDHPEVKTYLGDYNQKIIQGAGEVVVSPGVFLPDVAGINDVELFLREAKAPIVAITGSNGKSSVTTLVGEMAKRAGLNVAVGGNIGVPMLDLLAEEVELYVLELSSFQLERVVSMQSAAATILNISADHMDRYRNIQEYISTKQNIYKDCDIPVVNRQYPLYDGDSPTVSFGLDRPKEGHFGVENRCLCYGDERLLDIKEMQLAGTHNVLNALAALALGRAAGLAFESMLSAIKCFAGLKHRCQLIANIREVSWYNDSKGTNIGATITAIDSLAAVISGKLVLIAGGQGKGADFRALFATVNNSVKRLILIGEDAKKIAKSLHGACEISFVEDMQEAVFRAGKAAKAGDAVLLSPACASFDMFKNFEERGDQFIEYVKVYSEQQKY